MALPTSRGLARTSSKELTLEELRNKQRKVRNAIVAGNKQAKRVQDRAWFLSEWLTRVLLIIYTLADGAVDPAVVFLRTQGQRRGWSDRADSALATNMNKWGESMSSPNRVQ